MPSAQNSNPTNTAADPSADADATAAGTTRPTSSEFSLGAPAAPGEVGVLGPYRIVKELGKGGMGAVYLAVDTRLDRELALKVMLPAFAADPAARERFLREAKAVAKVAHDHVVTIFEADERDGVPYIAMQFLQGAPLDDYLKKKGSPGVAHCVRIVREAALGLAAAHARGLVHRDIKPANLWLEAPNGRVKVLDFGLAKPIGADTELTKSGAVVGTPAYMSPEQARGARVDHRTDIYSLGAVLYKLLTGRNPFVGEHVMAVLTALAVDEPTPVRELNPNVPPALADLVSQLLAKKPEARPQTAAEVAERLRTILSQPAAEVSASVPVVVQPVPVPMQVSAVENAFANLTDDEEADDRTEHEAEPVREPAGAPKRGKGLLLAGGALALVAVAGVAIALGTGGKKPDDVAKSDPPTPPPVIRQQGKKDRENAPEKDKGDTKSNSNSAWVTGNPAAEKLVLNGHSDRVRGAAFNGDGTLIVTASEDGTAKVWNAKTGKEARTLKGHTDKVLSAMFSTDGTRIVTGSYDRTAKIWDAQTGTEVLTIKGCTSLVIAAFSPDGTQIVTGGGESVARVWDTKSGAEVFTLRGHDGSVGSVSFSTDGSRIATGSADGAAKIWDAKTGAELLTLKGHTRNVTSVSFNSKGTLIVTASWDGTVIVWDPKTGNAVTTMRGHSEGVNAAAFSADGTRIVTGSHDHTAKIWDVMSGAEILALRGHTNWVYAAAFSPDGRLVVTASADGTAKVWEARPAVAPFVSLTPEGETEWSKLWVAHGAQDWKLQDGKLMNGNSGRGWIGTRAEYTDFELELEYKLGAKGNSGVFLRAWADGEINGSQFVEVQLIDDDGYKTAAKTCTGAVFGRVEPNPRPVTKLNEWNAATVRVVGKRVTVTINGTKCVDSDVEFPRSKGVIGLQQLDSPVEFRNVRVRDLNQVAAADADRAAAEWVLLVGGKVGVQKAVGGYEVLTEAAKVPAGAFRILRIELNKLGPKVTDADLARLRGLSELHTLELHEASEVTDVGLAHLANSPKLEFLVVTKGKVTGTGLIHTKNLNQLVLGWCPVTDEGLKRVGELPRLQGLSLNYSAVTDAHLAHLKGLTELYRLELGSTQVTDAGLEHLAGLAKLTSLIVSHNPKVTEAGVQKLAKTLPECTIIWGNGQNRIEPKK